jgi:hypothetical protein
LKKQNVPDRTLSCTHESVKAELIGQDVAKPVICSLMLQSRSLAALFRAWAGIVIG